MDAGLKERWVAALRSGDYEQGRGILRYKRATDDKLEFCCLGVLLDIYEGCTVGEFGYYYSNDTGDTNYRILEGRVGLTTNQVDTFIDLNDDKEKTFPEIADYVEANI